MPGRICRHPGCGRTTRGPYCERHNAASAGQATDDQRGYRGDGGAWQKLADEVKAEWLATVGPFCALCRKVLTPGRDMHADHLVPFNGIDDPKRLDKENVRVLCGSCNSRRAKAQKTSGN